MSHPRIPNPYLKNVLSAARKGSPLLIKNDSLCFAQFLSSQPPGGNLVLSASNDKTVGEEIGEETVR